MLLKMLLYIYIRDMGIHKEMNMHTTEIYQVLMDREQTRKEKFCQLIGLFVQREVMLRLCNQGE